MLLKRIKLDHYIILDGFVNSVRDLAYDADSIEHPFYQVDEKFFEMNKRALKVTHSTEPLNKEFNDWFDVKIITLEEVEEFLIQISVRQKAVDFAGDRNLGAGHGYPSYTANLIEKAFISGYKQSLKDNKDKKYTEKDIIKAIKFGQLSTQESVLKLFEKKGLVKTDITNNFIESLRPKTEWKVEFIDEELKLIENGGE